MCGIVAYIGDKPAQNILINGLKRLEYRGYDSAGIVLLAEGKFKIFKKKGKVNQLLDFMNGSSSQATMGIGHTRWATHGAPNDINAHPHVSQNGKLAIIHNGIIENYEYLKKELINRGYHFKSETDTEILVNFIQDVQEREKVSLEKALKIALSKVVGAFAIVVISTEEPEKIIAVRKGSPLVLGIGEEEYFLASDSSPIVAHTKQVIYPKEEEFIILEKKGFKIKNYNDVIQTPYIEKLELELEAIEKGGYPHFMLKEIAEQPNSIKDCMRGRLNLSLQHLKLGGISKKEKELLEAEKIIIIGCGTSWHAGLVAEYLIEDICRIPVEVEYASEFRYRNPVINDKDVVIAISQSGETADTLAAIKLAKQKGATVFGIVNVVGSTIAREVDEGAYLHAGPEIGVASTKAFTAQLTVLSMMALRIAIRKKTITQKRYLELLAELDAIPNKVAEVLKGANKIEELAELFKSAKNFLYLGRGYNFPVALEGALKLKEISYIHAEGYPAAEMKHGPIALIDEDMPVIFIVTQDSLYDKIVSSIQEVKARNGKVIAIITQGDKVIPQLADYVIEVPSVDEILMPLVSVIPLQLLSYYIAILRGCDVDQPRNLAKSVTVE